jgi:hypothetical protein
LSKADFFSYSDPYVTLNYRTHPSLPWTDAGQTECLKNNQSPIFSTPLELPYYFERHQYLKFKVYDQKDGCEEHTLLGEMECTLAQVILSESSTFTKPLTLPGDATQMTSQITISAQELTSGRRFWSVFAAYGLPMSVRYCCMARLPRAAYRLYEVIQGRRNMIYGSEVVTGTVNPIWKPADILVSFEAEGALIAQVYDAHSTGEEEILGECHVPIHVIETGIRTEMSLDGDTLTAASPLLQQSLLVHEKSAQVKTFFDYFATGGQISLAIGIDLTASNGNPSSPSSLHYRGGDVFYPDIAFNPDAGLYYYNNPYQRAIHEIVSILEYYDSDKEYPVYGFGCKLPIGQYQNRLSHCFSLTGDHNQPVVRGVHELFRAYANTVKSVVFWGPSLFAPLINTVATLVRERNSPFGPCRDYTILLIITDGQIMDMDDTKKAIVDASTLPLSILILGVGSDDFSSMAELDADRHPLCYSDNGEYHAAKRDILHFVNINFLPPKDHEGLLKHLLAEIPRQYMDFQRISLECHS